MMHLGNALAECTQTANVTKCAQIPESFPIGRTQPGSYTDSSWSVTFNNVIYSGNNATCTAYVGGSECSCEFNSPFMGTVVFATGPMSFSSPYQACANMYDGEIAISLSIDNKLHDDICPDGFFSVPYDVSCGDGLIDVSDIPECDNDTSGDYCFIENANNGSECVSVDSVTKCAQLPSPFGYSTREVSGVVLNSDGKSWTGVYDNKFPISVVADGDANSMDDMTCIITSPFYGVGSASWEPSFTMYETAGEICAFAAPVSFNGVSRLETDECPDGFFTVPYDVSCGDGSVNIADVPNCDNDTSGEYCFIDNTGIGDTTAPEINSSCKTTAMDTSNQTWTWNCGGDKVVGNYICSDKSGPSGDLQTDISAGTANVLYCWCKINLPYDTYWVSAGEGYIPNGICQSNNTGCIYFCSSLSVYDGEVGNFGSQAEMDAYLAALQTSASQKQRCALGISLIKTSTGLSFPLYAEKYSEPSFVVGYGGGMCYGELSAGNASNSINIQYNNQTYHLVK